MPELPEVETMRRGILPIVGGRISSVEFPRLRCKPILVTPERRTLRRRLAGRKILDVGRLGKRVLVWMDGDTVLVLEPRMTGLVLLADPPDLEHLRLRLELDCEKERQLLFWDRRGLGSVQLWTRSEFNERYHQNAVGPDALEASVDVVRERLGTSRRAIKVALLDQRPIAGIGNLYASEILHAAGISPRKPCHRLRAVDWSRLHAAIQGVLTEAIRYEGSTLSDGTYRNALNQQGGYQNHHRVYDREGEPCPTCRKATIKRIVQAQRSTFYCPRCQRG
jgi:formamidopyrimidine-DNA glycosylase